MLTWSGLETNECAVGGMDTQACQFSCRRDRKVGGWILTLRKTVETIPRPTTGKAVGRVRETVDMARGWILERLSFVVMGEEDRAVCRCFQSYLLTQRCLLWPSSGMAHVFEGGCAPGKPEQRPDRDVTIWKCDRRVSPSQATGRLLIGAQEAHAGPRFHPSLP
jgi:hypothetical protein